MNDLSQKVHLARSLNNMKLLFLNEYDFYSMTVNIVKKTFHIIQSVFIVSKIFCYW
jgi:hypothetical protein